MAFLWPLIISQGSGTVRQPLWRCVGRAVAVAKKLRVRPTMRFSLVIASYGTCPRSARRLRSKRDDKRYWTKVEASIREQSKADFSHSICPDNYNLHPENAVRVTCVHEFFHTKQYAIARTIGSDKVHPDNYPLGWLEGTAVLMEDLGFDYVNDYFQYTDTFFSDPTIPFLWDSQDYYNSLITMYLHKFLGTTPDTDFIHHIFFNTLHTPMEFHQELRTTTQNDYSGQWTKVLNDFHTRSFFTGNRARSGYFITDAPLLGEWSYTHDNIDSSRTITKTAPPYGMQIFSTSPQASDGDTLNISFTGEQPSESITYPVWAVSSILRKPGTHDSIVQMSISNLNHGTLKFPQWQEYNEILLIASNAYPSSSLQATVGINTSLLSSFNQLAVFPNPARLSQSDEIRFYLNTITDITIYNVNGTKLCRLTTTSVPPAFQKDIYGYRWNLSNQDNKKIVPGIYAASIGYVSSSTSQRAWRKLLVTP